VQSNFYVEVEKNLETSRLIKKAETGDGLMKQYKTFKKSMALLDIALTTVSNFFEKWKNLIMWTDPQRTFYFIIFSVCAYCVIEAFSMRILLLFSVSERFIRGMWYYKWLYRKNKEMSSKALLHVIKNEFPDLLTITTFKDLNQPWPTSVNFNTFQKEGR